MEVPTPVDKTTLYLTDGLRRALKDAARRQGRPQAELVREALERYLQEQPRPWPKSIGMISDGTLDASTIKDWIRENWTKDLERELNNG
jgi:hypothetical protein